MFNAKWSVCLPAILAMVSLAGCGKSAGGNAGPVSPTPVSVAFQSAPPASLDVGSAPIPIAAVVTNDPSGRGVDWLLTCSTVTNCGTLAPLHTESGASTTYTPPANVSGSAVTVNIVAFASSDRSANVPASIALASLNRQFGGTYVFDVSATAGGFPYHTSGVLVADGSGLITGGEMTDFNPAPDPIVSGTYQIGSDGRGSMAFSLSGGNTINFSFVLLSSDHALINETDDFFGGFGTGTMDLQTSAAPPSGSYAFVVGGNVGNDPTFSLPNQPESIGGVFNVDSPGTISGAGSVADENLNGAVTLASALTGSVSSPDAFGSVTIMLTAAFSSIPIPFTGYIIDSNNIKLVAFPDPNTGLGFYIGGSAIGQGSLTGTFVGNSAFSGIKTYGILGQRQSMSSSGEGPMWATAAWSGLFNADGGGQLTGGLDDQNVGGAVVSDTLTGTYSVDSSGTGRVTASTTFGSAGPGPSFVFYLTGNGSVLVLDTDSTATGAGIAYPSTAGTPAFTGPFGFDYVAEDGTQASGQMTVDGTAGTLAGQISVDTFGTASPISGAFVSTANGRFPGSLGLPNATVTGPFYLADPTQGFFIETDGTQVALQYFATQTALQGALRRGSSNRRRTGARSQSDRNPSGAAGRFWRANPLTRPSPDGASRARWAMRNAL